MKYSFYIGWFVVRSIIFWKESILLQIISCAISDDVGDSSIHGLGFVHILDWFRDGRKFY